MYDIKTTPLCFFSKSNHETKTDIKIANHLNNIPKIFYVDFLCSLIFLIKPT